MEERLLASKILLVGDKAAGKSSLARVFAGKAFTESYHPTTTVETFMVSIPDLALTRQVHVVDTPGADSLSELQLIAMRNIPLSDCYIVFDTTSSKSYSVAEQLVKELKQVPRSPQRMLLVGTKIDLDDNREVFAEDIRYFLWEHSIPFIETSARSGHHVADVFLRRGLLDSYRHRDAPPLLETQQPPEGM